MKTNDEKSGDPRIHREHIKQLLGDLIHHTRADLKRVAEPRFHALLEKTAGVLDGLNTAFQNYAKQAAPAPRRRGSRATKTRTASNKNK